jgi:hypothetical protein
MDDLWDFTVSISKGGAPVPLNLSKADVQRHHEGKKQENNNRLEQVEVHEVI